MLDIVARSQRGRVCEYTRGEVSVTTPFMIGSEGPVSIRSAEGGRVMDFFGTEVPLESGLLTTASSGMASDAVVKDGVQGVYVLDGNTIVFKKINVVYEEATNYICSLPDEDDKSFVSDTELSLYDQIITEGRQIYEGRVLS